MSPLRVLVAVGTDHHRFTRLIDWVAILHDENEETAWFVQHGSTPLPPGLDGSPMLSAVSLDSRLRAADAVVTHGGPGLIFEARGAGHVPVVVPRDPALGEHVDEHQLRFTERLADQSWIHRVTTLDDFRAALDQAAVEKRDVSREDGAGEVAAARFEALVTQMLSSRAARKNRRR